jgi:hypothetical protein
MPRETGILLWDTEAVTTDGSSAACAVTTALIREPIPVERTHAQAKVWRLRGGYVIESSTLALVS